MEYSKVKYVKPSEDGLDITKDKVYKLSNKSNSPYRHLTDDVEDEIYVYILKSPCVHLRNEGYWIPCTKDGTPL